MPEAIPPSESYLGKRIPGTIPFYHSTDSVVDSFGGMINPGSTSQVMDSGLYAPIEGLYLTDQSDAWRWDLRRRVEDETGGYEEIDTLICGPDFSQFGAHYSDDLPHGLYGNVTGLILDGLMSDEFKERLRVLEQTGERFPEVDLDALFSADRLSLDWQAEVSN